MANASIAPAELVNRIERGDAPVVLDVRSAREFADGHVPGALNIPFLEVGARLRELPARAKDGMVVYCGHGPRAWLAGSALRRGGFTRVTYLRGHMAGWRRQGLEEARTT